MKFKARLFLVLYLDYRRFLDKILIISALAANNKI